VWTNLPRSRSNSIFGPGAGANGAFLTPFGDVVYECTSIKNGITCVALSQLSPTF
jgi:hypothetical protein